jgi:hypothetical protein
MSKWGSAGWSGVAEEDGGATGIERREVGDEANDRGLCGGDRKEKRRHARNSQSRREDAFWQICQGGVRPSGLYGGGGGL